MSNDLSTLSGALLEMKDELIYQLGQKGVTASYSSTDGLLGLIGKIADIQTGGGGSCYHIEFSEASYVAVGGSATLEVYLQSNYAPLANATVTVTGSDSSLYTGITNSNGVAEVIVTNVTGTVTFTCSYSNVTDTCTVTTSSVIYQPALDGTETKKQISGTTTISNGVMSGGASYLTGGWDNTGNWQCTFDAYIPNDNAAVGVMSLSIGALVEVICTPPCASKYENDDNASRESSCACTALIASMEKVAAISSFAFFIVIVLLINSTLRAKLQIFFYFFTIFVTFF